MSLTKTVMCGPAEKPKEKLTRDAALATVRHRQRLGAAPGRNRAYPCRFCDFWHVGTRMPEVMLARRRRTR